MDCETCRAQLAPYLDSTLAAAEQTAVAAHLDDCEACRLALDELRFERLGAAVAPSEWSVPSDLATAAWDEAHQRLADPLALALGRSLPPPTFRTAGALAAAAVVAIAVWSAVPAGEAGSGSDHLNPSVALAWLDKLDESAVEPPSWPLPRSAGSSSPSSCLPSWPHPPRGRC